MKSKVQLSNFCFFGTVLTLVLFVSVIFIYPEKIWWVTWMFIIVPVLIISLYYAPLSIEVTDKDIFINRSLSFAKRLPLNEVRGVARFVPKNAIRTCGSGGFLGFWGWFYSREVGKYFAYHGKISDCFIVELADGRKYLLGCKDPDQVVERIENSIKSI